MKFISQLSKMDNNPTLIIDRKNLWKTQKEKKHPNDYNNQKTPHNQNIGGDTSKP